MNTPPKWFLPVAIVALLWNLMGCAAYLADVMLTPADVAKMSAADQLLYAARPAWSVAATAIAVWIGALGCVGLILRKRWALPALITSLIGVLAQDVSLFAMSGADVRINPVVLGLQGMVLLIAIGLIVLTRRALARGWIAAK